MIRFLRVFCTLPQLQEFSLVLSTSSTWFLHEKAPEGFQKVPKGCHRAPLKQMGILSGKIALLLKVLVLYIYIRIRFLKRIAHFQKNVELYVMLHLLNSCAFLWICTWQRHIYISILKGWLHCKSLWMPGFLPPNLPLFQEAACIFAECYLLCSKEIHLEGCCTRWRSARSLECRAFKMECQTFLKEQPLAKGWLYLLRWVLYLLINRLHFVWIQLCLNVNVAFFLKKIKKTALILCTLR